jgi:D-alanyl-lipoteichoic acid acyltransferase DltB (MBOAT superfamily)
VSTATLSPPSAVPRRASGAVAFGPREYALTAVSLAALVLLLPPAQLGLYAAVAACGYFIAASPFSRNAKLALACAALAGFLYLMHGVPRPDMPLLLWGGYGIEVFFVLRLIDYAVSPYRKQLCPHPRDRVAQYLLYLFFLPTLFSGPSATFGDFYSAYQPGSGRRGRELLRNGLRVGWGAAKFYVLSEPILRAAYQFKRWGDAGETPYAFLDPHLSLWTYVAVWMVYFYVAFSGFCDMATGVSRLLGFQLYDNFDHPLVARDPGDYWKRWNISGRKWLVKHAFYPYWGHDQFTLKIMTTFWASGLWHLAIAIKVSADAAIQLFAAVTVYGAAVALFAAVERRPALQASLQRAGARIGHAGRWAVTGLMIAFTFLFTAVIHQVFWGGQAARPLAATLDLLRGLFWLN